MQKLIFRAGREAFQRIRSHKFNRKDIKAVVSAAGGPKWFTTYGLTRYIISDLIDHHDHEMHFIGSSVGSWQMTSALTKDPAAAIDRLQDAYCNFLYSDKPDGREISEACASIISTMLNNEHDHILNHTSRRLHIVTSRGKGWLGRDNRFTMGAGFAFSFMGNALHRTRLKHTFERVIFSNHIDLPYNGQHDLLPTTFIPLTEKNLLSSLRASGTIPYLMRSIRDVPGGPTGCYWDGGITDYHMTFPYSIDGIVLHPHFLPYVLPGWFDKKLPWKRKASENFMSKVLLVTPSEEFVKSLPRKKISELGDLKYFGLDQQGRIDYWSEISKRSLELGQEMKEIIESGSLAEVVRPYGMD